jgi:type III secretory pathway component EscS
MTNEELVLRGITLLIILSGVPLIIGTALGTIVAILQSVTQIQEQSIGLLVKVSAVTAVFILGWSIGKELFIRFCIDTFIALPFVGS